MGAAPGWMRVVIVTGAVLAVLLLGASAGLLVPMTGGEPAEPAADSVAVGFSQDMSVHHRQGVLMAGLARDRSTDPEIQTVAYDIETTQLEQVGRMQGWLSLWDAAAFPTGPHMAWMAGAGMPHGSSQGAHGGTAGVAVMPGMASPEEIERLRAASGPAFDVLFLQLMARHHQGGESMMEHAVEHAQVPQVRNLAKQMLTSQQKEVIVMTEMLAARGAEPLAPPA